MKKLMSKLEIKNYCISMLIGCTPEEYEKPQKISFDVSIQFKYLPSVCTTDELSESYCYAKMTDLIAEVCHEKHYKLIEHLAYSIFEKIKKNLKPEDKLFLRVHKIKPPISGLEGGAAFCCYDQV